MLLVNVDIYIYIFPHHLQTANRESSQIHKPSTSAGHAVAAFPFFLIIFNSEMFLYDCMTAALLSHPTQLPCLTGLDLRAMQARLVQGETLSIHFDLKFCFCFACF